MTSFKQKKTFTNNGTPIFATNQKESSSSSPSSSSSFAGENLIEQWPQNKSEIKRVKFSQLSILRIYPKDDSYIKNMSYTSKEQKEFYRDAVMESVRMRSILCTLTEGCRDQQMEICFGLLESHGVGREEIAGLEHLIFEISPKLIIKMRQMHARSVLLEQEKQIIMGLRDEDSLAIASECTSKCSLFKARVRASIQLEQIM
ncbi:hypothetical protein ACHAXS_000854 [Conticribra weissflogii]